MKAPFRISALRRRSEPAGGGRLPSPPATSLAAGALLAGGLLASAGPLGAQEKIPRIPSGVPLVVTPVQAVLPTAAGAFPGGTTSREAALEALNAEVDFAVSEEPRASKWASPARVVRAAERNPMLDVDPRQLSSRGLTVDDGGRYLYEPLHGQLRSLAALLDARMVALPLVVWYRPAQEIDDGGDGAPDAADDGDGAGGDDSPGEGSDASTGGEAAASRTTEAGQGRAMMRLVLVDARAGKVLWKGEIGGARAPADSPAALATLAAQLVKVLSNS